MLLMSSGGASAPGGDQAFDLVASLVREFQRARDAQRAPEVADLADRLPLTTREAHAVAAQRRAVAGVVLQVVHLDRALQLGGDPVRQLGERQIEARAAAQRRRQSRQQRRIQRQLGGEVARREVIAQAPLELPVRVRAAARERHVRGELRGEQACRPEFPGEVPEWQVLRGEPAAGAAPQRAFDSAAGEGRLGPGGHHPARRQACHEDRREDR